jgi:Divergent InlB B-repeat domain/Collagen triple helix repeat (20 copies)
MSKRIGLLAAGGLAVALVAGGGTALGASSGPVTSTGLITGCYTNAEVNGSHAVVLQDGGTACPKGTSAISWAQQGPAGPAGAAGPAGPAGATGPAGPAGANGTSGANGSNGTSIVTSPGSPTGACTTGDSDVDLANGEVYTCTAAAWTDSGSSIKGPQGPAGPQGAAGNGATVAQLATGDTNCPSGGASITDGSGNTAYVCNGAPGTGGAAGATSLDSMIGSPCDVNSPNAGTLQVTYTPQTNGTDTISWLCSQNNPQYALNVTVDGYPYTECTSEGLLPPDCTTYSGYGTVTSSDGLIDMNNVTSGTQTAVYSGGTVVTLTATPGSQSTFDGWSGCTSTDGTTCTVTMNAVENVTAFFQF